MTLLVMMLTTVTAWADVVKGTLLGNATDGYYVNMPTTNTIDEAPNIDLTDIYNAGVTSIMVYDDGGKDGDYSNSCSGYLKLTAPTGYVLQLLGTVTTEFCDVLTVYDGNTTSATKLLDAVSSSSSGTETAVGPVVTTGQSMTLYFNSDNGVKDDGLNLTVRIVNPNTQHNIIVSNPATGGTMASDQTTHKVNENVTLTATPADGYALISISVKDADNHDIAVAWDGHFFNTATFTMPASDVTVTPTFTNDLTSLYINMPTTDMKTATIPEGVTSFKLYDDGGKDGRQTPNSNGTLVLTAPTGYVFQLSGDIDISSVHNDYLRIYDGIGTSGDYTQRIGKQNISWTSTGSSMTINFITDTNSPGLNLTVTLLNVNDFTTANVSGLETGSIYTGSEISLGYTVKNAAGTTLTEGTHYSVGIKRGGETVSNVQEVGTYTLTFTGLSPYSGEIEKTFVVAAMGLTGDGLSAETAYGISSTTDLKTLAGHFNNGYLVGSNYFYKLTTDLDFTGDTYITIGNDDYRFSGTFDGQEHTISGVSLTMDAEYAGLFAQITGTVKNLSLATSTITNTNSTWYNTTGGIVGANIGGLIENCHVAADVTVSGNNHKAGGIVGFTGAEYYSTGKVYGCTSAANVSGKNNSTGGIAGERSSGEVRKCLYYGANEIRCVGDGYDKVGPAAMDYIFNTHGGESTYNGTISYVVSSDEDITLTFSNLGNDAHIYTDKGATDHASYGTNRPIHFYDKGVVFDGKLFTYNQPQSVTVTATVTGSPAAGYSFCRIAYTHNTNNNTQTVTYYDNSTVDRTIPQIYRNETFTTEWAKNITLANGTSNATVIADNDGRLANVTLADRTLKKNGYWNTLCLPFSLSDSEIAGSPLANATIMEMQTSTSLANGVLTLNFATVTAIEAGKPYLIKWNKAADYEGHEANYDIVEPTLMGVTIASTTPTEVTSTDGKVTFVGQYSPFAIDSNNKDRVLMLGSGNKIGYSKNDRTLKCFRAHFMINDVTAVREFNMNFDNDNVTGIVEVNGVKEVNGVNDNSWYTIDGRKVANPTKGLYIINGKKVVK